MSRFAFFSKRINLFIISVSILMMLAVLYLPFKAKPFGDITFHAEAKTLALYIKGKVPFENVTISKAPGPVLFYLPAYMAAPSDASDYELWVYGVSFASIFITVSLILIFRIGASFFNKETGLLSVLLFFIFPIHCYYVLGIMAEAPAFFSLSLGIYGWSKAYHQPHKLSGWIMMTTGFLLLVLNRPNAILILGLGITVVLFSWLKYKSFYRLYGKKMAASLCIIGVTSFGILQLAKKINENKIGMSQNDLLYYVAHQGRFQFREEPTDFRFWDDSNRADSKDYQHWLKSLNALNADMKRDSRTFEDVYKEFLIADAVEHPYWFARQFVVKCFYGHVYFVNSVKPAKFSIGPLKGPFGYAVFTLLVNMVNLVIIIGAVLFLLKEKNLIAFWPFWGVIIALLIFHGLTYMEPRYIFPSRVALYIMSAAGLYRINIVKRALHKISVYLF